MCHGSSKQFETNSQIYRQVVTARLKKSAKTKPDAKDAKAGAEQEKTPENYMKGDWKCPNCANHNYAKRKECMKCSAPHPDSAAAKKAVSVISVSNRLTFDKIAKHIGTTPYLFGGGRPIGIVNHILRTLLD
jgi:hypothetical protein